MKQRPQTGFNLCSTTISAQHKNGAKKQMKRNQTSERKNTQMSLIFHLFFFVSYNKYDFMLWKV